MDNHRLIQPTVKMGTDEEYSDLLNLLSPQASAWNLCMDKQTITSSHIQSLAAPQVKTSNLGLYL